MGPSNSELGWAQHGDSPEGLGEDCGDAMDYLYPAMGAGEGSSGSSGSGSNVTTLEAGSSDDPSDDRSFPFFLSASILRQQNVQNQYIPPERTCYPSHGMGPMGSMSVGMRGAGAGGAGGCEGGGQWQANYPFGRHSGHSDQSRHALLAASGLHGMPGRGEDVLAMMGAGGGFGAGDDSDLVRGGHPGTGRGT